jgi:hypothetical protein
MAGADPQRSRSHGREPKQKFAVPRARRCLTVRYCLCARMSQETRIPLEGFHRHFVVTHMKSDAAAVFEDIRQQAERSGRRCADLLGEWIRSNYSQGAYQDDNWYVREIPLDKCYFAQTDFRGRSVPKDQRFVDFMDNHRQEIESGRFPCSSEIRAPWSGPMPEPLVQEREPERYYILDGQLRVIRHWHHSVSTVRVFIYRGNSDV